MAQKLKTGLALFALCILAIVAMDLLARGGIIFADEVLHIGLTEVKADSAAYDHADYDATQLIEEEDQISKELYRPYTIWGARPGKGELVNVDQKGNRVTLYNSARDEALRIWLLGGSTMFGIGAPDGQTIASHLAQLVNQTWGVDARIYNLGQGAYVSTQEVITVIRNLQMGERPHVIVLYDGYNDAVTADEKVPGAHFNFQETRDKFEKVLLPLVRSTGLYRAAKWVLIRRLNLDFRGEANPTARTREAEQAAHILVENYKIVTALGQAYGFIPFFIFQPSLVIGDKPYHPSELRMLPSGFTSTGNKAKDSTMYQMRRVLVREGRDNGINFYDISDVFTSTAEPIYIDGVHVTGRGNRIIAERMFEILKNELCDGQSIHVSDLSKAQLTSACMQGSADLNKGP